MTRRSPRAAPDVTASLVVRVVVLTPVKRRLAVRLVSMATDQGERSWRLPSAGPGEESLDQCARQLVESHSGTASQSQWIEQVRAIEEPSAAAPRLVAVDYVAIVPSNAPDDRSEELEKGSAWFPVSRVPPIPTTERAALQRAVMLLRSRVEQEPIAFRLLPATFTLSELQGAYELLLGQAVHKASFRRALLAAGLVAATDQWRQERRGRPARLYRYVPTTPRDGTRGVRFDRLGK